MSEDLGLPTDESKTLDPAHAREVSIAVKSGTDLQDDRKSAFLTGAVIAAGIGVVALPLIKVRDVEAAMVYCAADSNVGQDVGDPTDYIPGCTPMVPADCTPHPPAPAGSGSGSVGGPGSTGAAGTDPFAFFWDNNIVRDTFTTEWACVTMSNGYHHCSPHRVYHNTSTNSSHTNTSYGSNS